MIHPGLSGSRCRPALDSGCFVQDWSGSYQDKPQVLTSRTDKETGLEKYTEYPRPVVGSVLLVQFLMNFWEKEDQVSTNS